eukprot:1341441-Amorphochlora_amoeboformis.AAC.1
MRQICLTYTERDRLKEGEIVKGKEEGIARGEGDLLRQFSSREKEREKFRGIREISGDIERERDRGTEGFIVFDLFEVVDLNEMGGGIIREILLREVQIRNRQG